jgi:hypothetical protein
VISGIGLLDEVVEVVVVLSGAVVLQDKWVSSVFICRIREVSWSYVVVVSGIGLLDEVVVVMSMVVVLEDS